MWAMLNGCPGEITRKRYHRAWKQELTFTRAFGSGGISGPAFWFLLFFFMKGEETMNQQEWWIDFEQDIGWTVHDREGPIEKACGWNREQDAYEDGLNLGLDPKHYKPCGLPDQN